VVKKIPDARLVIVGDGPSKQGLVEKCKSAGLDGSIIFNGAVSEEEKINLLNQSQVLLNPSLQTYTFPPILVLMDHLQQLLILHQEFFLKH